MNKELTPYEEYAVLCDRIKTLTTLKETMVTKIMEDMGDESKKDLPVGKFTITKLKTWKYPANVVELGEEFEARKAMAQSTGDATFTEKPSLRFTPSTI